MGNSGGGHGAPHGARAMGAQMRRTVTETVVGTLECAAAVLSACEQQSPRRGPVLFVRAMADLWQEVGRVSEWGDPDRIEEKLRQFVGADAATPKETGRVQGESYHKLGLGTAVRVAVAARTPPRRQRSRRLVSPRSP